MTGPAPVVVADAADARRAAIVASSAELFNRCGYHQTTMDDIAKAIGIRKPTLYHYFRSKHEILFWIHEEVIDELLARHEARAATRMAASQGLLEIIADILEIQESRPGYARVFFEHFRELPEEEQLIVHAKRQRYGAAMEALIRQGVDEGEFRPVDARIATLAIGGMCNWAYQWFQPGHRLRGREVAYSFWDMVTKGLLMGDPPPAGKEER
jgi:AcrR family transcriptional regulator